MVRGLIRFAAVPSGPICCLTSAGLALVLVLLGLVPLADASGPDPLWVAGAYDGEDFDEVVVAVGSMTARAEAFRHTVGEPVVVEAPRIAPAVSRSPHSVRAPPA
jgi:hypothetical protein